MTWRSNGRQKSTLHVLPTLSTVLQKGEGKPSLPSPTTPKQSVLCRCPRYLRRKLRKLWLCGQRVLHCFIFPNVPHFTKVSTISWPIGRFTRLNSPLENEKKLDRVNFRKDFWDRKKWPIADRRVPSYDPTNNCGTHFGYTVSFFLLKWRIIKQ